MYVDYTPKQTRVSRKVHIKWFRPYIGEFMPKNYEIQLPICVGFNYDKESKCSAFWIIILGLGFGIYKTRLPIL